MFLLARRILHDLRDAGFDDAEQRAVRDTPAMWAQLTRFYRAGGRVERVAADFSGATGQPGLIRFFCPPSPQPCTHATYGALAHELGVRLYPPVPPPLARVAGVERLQMLAESGSRLPLQRLLAAWLPQLQPLKARHKGLLRWAVDVDPWAI